MRHHHPRIGERHHTIEPNPFFVPALLSAYFLLDMLHEKLHVFVKQQEQERERARDAGKRRFYGLFLTKLSLSLFLFSAFSMLYLFLDEVLMPSDSITTDEDTDALHQHLPIDLAFDSLKLTLQTKKKKKNGNGNGERLILDGSIRGRARPGRLLAIMGPSGAGKSTVLHALAGRIPESSHSQRLSLQGNRYVNGHAVPGQEMLPSLALIEQEVNFFPHMTVRETLDFRVHLQFGNDQRMTTSQRDALVQELLQQLGLSMVQDSIVGGPTVRGISGGERKRLSIAVEMITNPSLVFLDEPTTGTFVLTLH
jgi:ABC-type glutathione transport system ATPase component